MSKTVVRETESIEDALRRFKRDIMLNQALIRKLENVLILQIDNHNLSKKVVTPIFGVF